MIGRHDQPALICKFAGHEGDVRAAAAKAMGENDKRGLAKLAGFPVINGLTVEVDIHQLTYLGYGIDRRITFRIIRGLLFSFCRGGQRCHSCKYETCLT